MAIELEERFKKKVKFFDIEAGKYIAVMNEAEATEMDIFLSDRILLKHKDRRVTVIVDTSDTLVKPGEIGIYSEASEALKVKGGEMIEIQHVPRPASLTYIRKKMDRKALSEDEIKEIVFETVENKLSEGELASFIAGVYINGFTIDETVSLAKAMVAGGETLDLNVHPISDKHCLSGDTLIYVKQKGETKNCRIDEVADSVLKKCDKGSIINDGGAEFVYKNMEGLQALTFDDNGHVSFQPVTGIFRVKAPEELYEITLVDGRSIKVTSDHTVFVFREGKITNIMARDLNEMDFVIIPSNFKNGETKKTQCSEKIDVSKDLSALKIKEVKKVKSDTEYVYDLKIDGYNKFMAGTAPMCVHNCIGGVAGNRTTMILVPILAAAGVYIPKTSSRAITSPAGTADTMEVLAPVIMSIDELRKVVLKTYGCIVWGGAINLAPVDDKLIRIRHTLHLDPRGLLLASILGKKKAVGAEYLTIDIPIGRGAKIEDQKEAKDLARDFIEVSERLSMKTRCLLSDGKDPVGFGIGPGLECKDVIETLQGAGPVELLEKGCLLAGNILELVGKAPEGKGADTARSIVKKGKAWEKMKEIIEAQGGNPNIKVEDLPIGEFKYEVKAHRSGRVSHVDNRGISRIAKAAGAPKDKGAGIILHCEDGDKVKAGDVLFEIVAESESKLSFAINKIDEYKPVELQKIIIGKIE